MCDICNKASDVLLCHRALEGGALFQGLEVAQRVGLVALVEAEAFAEVEGEVDGDVGHGEAVGAEEFLAAIKRGFDAAQS